MKRSIEDLTLLMQQFFNDARSPQRRAFPTIASIASIASIGSMGTVVYAGNQTISTHSQIVVHEVSITAELTNINTSHIINSIVQKKLKLELLTPAAVCNS